MALELHLFSPRGDDLKPSLMLIVPVTVQPWHAGYICNWGEPERAPHRRVCCEFSLFLQVAELASLAQLLPPCSPTVRNPAPDSSLKSCFSPIASALLLPDCVHFSCCSRARLRHPLPLLLPVCLRLASSCCSPIAPASAAARRPITSASTAAPRLRPLELLLARLRPLRLLLPDCILDSSPCPGPMFSNILRGIRGSVNKLKYEGRACASL